MPLPSMDCTRARHLARPFLLLGLGMELKLFCVLRLFYVQRMAKRAYSGRRWVSAAKRGKYGKRFRRGRRTRRYRRRRRSGGFSRRVKRVMYNADEKHRYVNLQTVSVDATGGYFDLFVAAGQGEERESNNALVTNQRDGYKVQPTSCSIMVQFIVADATNVIRIMITQYLVPPAAGVPQATDFLYMTGPWIGVWCPYQRLNVPSRVKIRYDKRFTLSTASRPIYLWNWASKRFPSITYDANTPGSWRSNMWYIWMFSDSNVAPHVGCVLKITSCFVNI